LVEVGFLDPLHPKKLVPRMRHLLTRNHLSVDEVDMLRGMCTAMIKAAHHQTLA
jgi:tRNA/rRNA methyltransferase